MLFSYFSFVFYKAGVGQGSILGFEQGLVVCVQVLYPSNRQGQTRLGLWSKFSFKRKEESGIKLLNTSLEGKMLKHLGFYFKTGHFDFLFFFGFHTHFQIISSLLADP